MANVSARSPRSPDLTAGSPRPTTMNLISHIRNNRKFYIKRALYSLLFLGMLIGFIQAVWVTVLIGEPIYQSVRVKSTDDLTEIAVVDMHLDFEESVYLSQDGSYIGIFADKEDEEKAFEYTLIPRTRFEQNGMQSAYTGAVTGIDNLPYRTYDYPNRKIVSQEGSRSSVSHHYSDTSHTSLSGVKTEWTTDCATLPVRIKNNRLQIAAECEEDGQRHTFTLQADDMAVPRVDLPMYFNGASHYKSPLSDCAVYPSSTNKTKEICAEPVYGSYLCKWGDSCTSYTVEFVNARTQQHTKWSIPDFATETGFLDDGTFYVLLRHSHVEGIYVVPREYFVNNM